MLKVSNFIQQINLNPSKGNSIHMLMSYDNINFLIYTDNVDARDKLNISSNNFNCQYMMIFCYFLERKELHPQYPLTTIDDYLAAQK